MQCFNRNMPNGMSSIFQGHGNFAKVAENQPEDAKTTHCVQMKTKRLARCANIAGKNKDKIYNQPVQPT